MGIGKNAKIWRKKPDDADRYRRSEIPPDNPGIDFGAGKKGEEDRAESGEIVHPRRQCEVDEVAGDDFEKGNRNRNPLLHHRSDEREANPQSRSKPDILHPKPLVRPHETRRTQRRDHRHPQSSNWPAERRKPGVRGQNKTRLAAGCATPLQRALTRQE